MIISDAVPSDASSTDRLEPLSPKEEALWLFQQINPDAPVVVPLAFRLPRVLRWWPLHEALQQMVSRHPALRTVFPEVDGAPVRMVLAPGDARVAVDIDTLSTSPESLAADLTEFVRRPFDVAADSLIRLGHFTGDPAGDVICLTVHHLVSDAVSQSLLLEGIVELYDCLDRGDEIPSRFAAEVPRFVEPPASEEDLRYWRKHLEGAAATPLSLTDASAHADGSYAGRQMVASMPDTAVDLLSHFGKEAGATPNIVLLSVFYLLLARHGAGDDVVVITPLDARTREGRESVGYHVNICGVRVELDEAMTFRDLVRQTRETFLNGVLHARASVEEVAPGAYDSSTQWRSPLSRYMFNFSPINSDWTSRYGIEMLPVQTGFSRLDLMLGVVPRGDSILLLLTYREALFDSEAASALLARFSALLCACAAEPDRPVGELSIWSGQDRAAVTAAHNPAPSAGQPLPALISQRIREAAGAVAVRERERVVTLGELSIAAASLAGRLAGKGVGRGDAVGVWSSPGPETAAAILAVWHLGAVLVPLPRSADPTRLADLCVKLDVRTLVGEDVPEVLRSGRVVCAAEPDLAAVHALAPAIDVSPHDSALAFLCGDLTDPSGVVRMTHGELAAATAAIAHTADDSADTVLWAEGDTVLSSVLSLAVALSEGLTATVSEHSGAAAPPSGPAVRWVVAATDAVSSEPSAQVLSIGGVLPSLALAVGPADRTEMLGIPLPGTAATVLDLAGHELPPGLPGRLHLGGRATGITARWGWDGLLNRVDTLPVTEAATQLDTGLLAVPVEPVPEHDDHLVGVLVSLWRELLAKPQLDAQSHFFTNGGTSILAGRIVARIKTVTGARIPLKHVFTAPTPQQLAARVKELEEAGPSAGRR